MKTQIIWFFLVPLSFGGLYFYQKQTSLNAKSQLGPSPSLTTKSQVSVEQAAPEKVLNSKPKSCDEPCNNGETLALNSLQNFEAAVFAVDLWAPQALSDFAEKLRTQDKHEIARFFVESLHTHKQADSERRRLIAIAEIYAGEELGEFWQTVLNHHLNAEPRDKKDVFTAQEVYQTMRSLRLLATHNEATLHYLETLVLSPVRIPNLRQDAFFAVQEIDPKRALSLIQALDTKDPLLAEITTSISR